MKSKLITLLLVLFSMGSYAQSSYPFAWVKKMGTDGSYDDAIKASYVTTSGDLYVTGSFSDTVDFDPGPGVTNLICQNPSGPDIFIAKYTNTGNLVWARSIGTNFSGPFYMANSITVDNAGNCYVYGQFSGTLDFDPGSGVYNLTTSGFSSEIFLLKLNNSGNFVWAGKIGGGAFQFPSRITFDHTSNHFYITGGFKDTVDFDMGIGVNKLISGLGSDPFVAKYDDNGNLLWARNFKTQSMMGFGNSLKCVINSGNVVVTGRFTDTLDFDPGPGVFNLVSQGMMSTTIFVCQLNSAGNFMWANKIGNDKMSEPSDFIADNSNNLYLTGTFTGVMDFDPGPGVFNLVADTSVSAWNTDIFVLKLNNLGNFTWAKVLKGKGYEQPTSIRMTLNSAGDLFLAGSFSDTIDFDPGVGTSFLYPTPGTSGDGYVLHLTSLGNFGWVKQIKTNQYMSVGGIGVDNVDNLYIMGSFTGNCDFDPGPGTAMLTGEYTDAYILKLNQSPTTIQNTMINAAQLKVYPTITQDFVYIQPEQPLNYFIRIVDVTGKVMTQEYKQNATTISVHHYPNGMYKAFIQSIDGSLIETHTIIVQH